MILDIKKLISQKKYEDTFEFEVLPQQDMILVPLTYIEGNIKIAGNYIIYDDDSVDVEITVSYLLKGQCSYCLKEASKQVSFSDKVLFVPEDDGENYCYNGIKIDLMPVINDSILFSQPDLILCSEDCKGIDINE